MYGLIERGKLMEYIVDSDKMKNIDYNKALTDIINLNVKERLDYFNTHMYEVAHERKVITYHVIIMH